MINIGTANGTNCQSLPCLQSAVCFEWLLSPCCCFFFFSSNFVHSSSPPLAGCHGLHRKSQEFTFCIFYLFSYRRKTITATPLPQQLHACSSHHQHLPFQAHHSHFTQETPFSFPSLSFCPLFLLYLVTHLPFKSVTM